MEEFKSKIKEGYSKAKFANMANFYNSLIIAKNENFDLFYFVEDDYFHSPQAITEMIFSYEKFYTIFDKDLILIPLIILTCIQKMKVRKFILVKNTIGDLYLRA